MRVLLADGESVQCPDCDSTLTLELATIGIASRTGPGAKVEYAPVVHAECFECEAHMAVIKPGAKPEE